MNLSKNFFFSIILTASQYIFPIIIFPHISRVLGVSNIGKVEYVDSIVNYFILFSSMGVNILGIREVAKSRNNKELLQQAFSSLIFLHFLTTLFFFIVYSIIVFNITSLIEFKKLLLVGSAKILFSLILVEWLYKGLENFKLITIRTFVVKIIYTISVFTLVKESSDYLIYWYITVFSVVVNASINFFFSRKFVNFSVHKIKLKNYYFSYFKLGIYLLLTSMYTSFNVFFLGTKSGNIEVGYYSTAIKIYSVLLGVYTAFTNIMLPRMSSLIVDEKEEKFNQMINLSLKILFKMTIPIVFFGCYFAKEIIFLMSGSGYEGAVLLLQILLPLVIIVGISQVLSVQILMPLHKDNSILIASILGSVIGVLLNFLLVEKLKSLGSSLTCFFSEIMVMIVLLFFVHKYYRLNFSLNTITRNIIIAIPIIFIGIVIENYIDKPFFILATAGVITFVYLVFINLLIKDEIVLLLAKKLKLIK